MKLRILTALTALTVLFSLGFSQSNSLQAQVFEEGNFMIEGYIGFPNLYTTVLKNTYTDEVTGVEENIEVGGIGPLGIRGEYIVTEKFGIGFDINYSDSHISWEESYTGSRYTYKVNVPRFRAMAKFNFHYVNMDKFNAYTSVGAGYGSLKYKYETNDPFWVDSNEEFPIPVSFRLATGARYFFTDNVGVNLEFGLFGGALFHAGVSCKF